MGLLNRHFLKNCYRAVLGAEEAGTVAACKAQELALTEHGLHISIHTRHPFDVKNYDGPADVLVTVSDSSTGKPFENLNLVVDLMKKADPRLTYEILEL